MVSRRSFIKKMLGLLALVSGGGAAVWAATRKTSVEAAEPGPLPVKRAGAVDGTPKTPLLSFFLLSDLHISVSEGSMTERLHYALKDISSFESGVDALLLGGDLTDFARDSDYRLLKSIMSQYTLPPVYANMGNHDYYDIWLTRTGEFSTETAPNGKTDAMSRKRFMDFIGYPDKPYTDVWLNGVHLIMLSQEAYFEEKPEVGEGAWYSDAQMAWFKQKMQEHDNNRKPAIVFIHQPLPDPGTDGGTHRLVRAKEFRAILEPYKNVFVLSGHSHRTFYGEEHYNWQNSFHWFNNASVGRTRAASGTTAQGMYVQVYPHKVVIRGREFVDRSWIQEARWDIPLL
ncbi:metallophosphoesterase family protein [Paenibacillus silviterrae]|uniref:metallophosphoesterase family protein n=1 Tax=Paenibacillus silviterrae TaxID=3242194 RepID=UPI002542F55F|nr:metallophosphoesterase [Paenibacillus chinjuensis]